VTLVAGVDSSTQSTKVVVCDATTGKVVRSASAPHPEGTSVDPAAWWSAFEIARAGGLLDDVAAISVAGQQHGMVLLDETRSVVRPALLWNDTRSAPSAAALVKELGGPGAWADAVGSVPVASFTVTKLRWVAEHEPASAAAAQSVALPHDWLTSRLLSDGGLVTDRGDASGTGYWSPTGYRDDLMSMAFGRVLQTPRVLAPSEAAGTTDSGILVAAGTGDNMGAALGLGVGPGDVVVSIGTSGTAFAVHDSPVADPSGTPWPGSRTRQAGTSRWSQPSTQQGFSSPRPSCSAPPSRSSTTWRSRPRQGRTGSSCCRTSTASGPRTCPTPRAACRA
jgi:xylulokinase